MEEETSKRLRIPGRKPLMDDWNQVAPDRFSPWQLLETTKAAYREMTTSSRATCLHACMRWHALGLQVPPSCVVAPQPTTRTISKITGDSRNYPALSRYAFLCPCIRAGVTPTGFSVIFNPGLGRAIINHPRSALSARPDLSVTGNLLFTPRGKDDSFLSERLRSARCDE